MSMFLGSLCPIYLHDTYTGHGVDNQYKHYVSPHMKWLQPILDIQDDLYGFQNTA